MITDLYQKELQYLKELVADFIKAHPSAAHLMGGATADADVERLLEGTAFMAARLRQKLDDDYPEIINTILHDIQPQYLRPIPATTIIAFTPKQNCTEARIIPERTHLDSAPVDGTSCRFATSFPVEIHLLALTDASFAQPAGLPPVLTLNLELRGVRLADWRPKSLRLFLGGKHANAVNLYLLLMRHLKRIVFAPCDNGKSVVLEPAKLQPAGFSGKEALFPYPAPENSAYQCMQDFFHLPGKFLFLDLHGWESWHERGEGTKFAIRFELEKLPFPAPQVTTDDFILFAAPAVNVFPHQAEPVILDGHDTNHLLRPQGDPDSYNVYDVMKVTGYADRTAQEINFSPVETSNPGQHSTPVYRVIRANSTFHHGYDTYLSVKEPDKPHYKRASHLDVHLLCTNGKLAEKVKTGDIRKDTDSSPNFAEFANCKPVTSAVSLAFGSNLLWRLYSQCYANLSLLTADNLRAMLKLISFSDCRDRTTALANERKISGIADLQIKSADRLIGPVMTMGREIRIKLNRDYYVSPGDMFLFGALLDHFLGGFASESSFIRTVIEDVQSGVEYGWPARMGRRHLL